MGGGHLVHDCRNGSNYIPLRESSNTMESDFLNSQGKQKLVQVIGEFEKLRVLKLQCLTQRSFF